MRSEAGYLLWNWWGRWGWSRIHSDLSVLWDLRFGWWRWGGPSGVRGWLFPSGSLMNWPLRIPFDYYNILGISRTSKHQQQFFYRTILPFFYFPFTNFDPCIPFSSFASFFWIGSSFYFFRGFSFSFWKFWFFFLFSYFYLEWLFIFVVVVSSSFDFSNYSQTSLKRFSKLLPVLADTSTKRLSGSLSFYLTYSWVTTLYSSRSVLLPMTKVVTSSPLCSFT